MYRLISVYFDVPCLTPKVKAVYVFWKVSPAFPLLAQTDYAVCHHAKVLLGHCLAFPFKWKKIYQAKRVYFYRCFNTQTSWGSLQTEQPCLKPALLKLVIYYDAWNIVTEPNTFVFFPHIYFIINKKNSVISSFRNPLRYQIKILFWKQPIAPQEV